MEEEIINFPEISLQNADADGLIEFSHIFNYRECEIKIFLHTYVNNCNYICFHWFGEKLGLNSEGTFTFWVKDFKTAYKFALDNIKKFFSNHVEFTFYRRAEHLLKVWAYEDGVNLARVKCIISGPKINQTINFVLGDWGNRIKAKKYKTEYLDAELIKRPELAFLTNDGAKQLTLF